MVGTILRGGLGNNLFMMAQVIGHSLKYNVPYCVPKYVDNPHYTGQKPYIFPGVNYCDEVLNLPLYKETKFEYNEIPFVDNVCFDGYWQSFKYFDDYRDEILKAFNFDWKFEKGWCGVHVRRGDYMKLPDYHPFVGEDFLKEAMDIINDKTGIDKFRIFSNDIEWCKSFFKDNTYIFEFVEGNNEMQDLEQGSYCEHQILSNGTFALWQFYLNQNPNKICVAPARWFGRFLSSHNTDDLYPSKNCIKI